MVNIGPVHRIVLICVISASITWSQAARIDKDVYDYCPGFDDSVDITVKSQDEVYLTAGLHNWSFGGSSCSVKLKASDGVSDLYYQFVSFSSTSGFQVHLESKFGFSYSDEATYGYLSSPSLYSGTSTNTYLKLTITRFDTADDFQDSIFFVVKIYRTDTSTDTSGDYTEFITQAYGLTIGVIVAIVVGCIAFVVIIIVLIVCCVVKSSNRGSSGGTVVTTQSVGMQGYPYAGQPYAAPTYPGQPYSGQPYSGQPHPGQPQTGQQYPAQPYTVGGSYPMTTDLSHQHMDVEPTAPSSETNKF